MAKLALSLGLAVILHSAAAAQVDTLRLQEINSINCPELVYDYYLVDFFNDNRLELVVDARFHVFIYDVMDGDLLWTSPEFPHFFENACQFEFGDINSDGFIDMGVKGYSIARVFDIAHDSLLWISDTLRTPNASFGVGDRNSDGSQDIIMFTRGSIDYDNDPDTLWMDIYDGPNFQLSEHRQFSIMSRYVWHGEYVHELYEVEYPGKVVVASLNGNQGLQRRIILFIPLNISGIWWDGVYFFNVSDWHGNAKIIDPIYFNTINISEIGDLISYSIETDNRLYAYTKISYRASVDQEIYFSQYDYVKILTADTLFRSRNIWYYNNHHPETMWSGSIIGDIDLNHGGRELCYGAGDSLNIFSYPALLWLWSARADSMAYSSVYLFQSMDLFDRPQILHCINRRNPYFLKCYDGTYGNLTALFRYDSLESKPSELIDLNGDNEDEILIRDRNSFAIYRIYDPQIGVVESAPLPTCFRLHPNYPNPFNAATIIEYDLVKDAQVNLAVYNILGEKIETLIEAKMTGGHHSVIWNAEKVASGIYFYKIQAGDFTSTKKMLLLK